MTESNNSLSVGIDDPNKIWRHFSYLTDVNLSNNKITILPRELGAVPHLKWLVLSNNNFGSSNEFHWRWLESTAIKNNLRFLDLSNNLLTELSAYIGKLEALTELILCHNSLTHLPQSIAKLRNLKILKSSNNKLEYLPGSMINMQLDTLDVMTNNFLSHEVLVNDMDNMELLTLFHATAKVVILNRLNQHSLPTILRQHLESSTEYCLHCQEPCFNFYVTRIKSLYFIFNSVKTFICDQPEKLGFKCYYCSPYCFEQLFNPPLPFEHLEENEDEVEDEWLNYVQLRFDHLEENEDEDEDERLYYSQLFEHLEENKDEEDEDKDERLNYPQLPFEHLEENKGKDEDERLYYSQLFEHLEENKDEEDEDEDKDEDEVEDEDKEDEDEEHKDEDKDEDEDEDEDEDKEDEDKTVGSTLSSFCLCCMYVYEKRLTFNF